MKQGIDNGFELKHATTDEKIALVVLIINDVIEDRPAGLPEFTWVTKIMHSIREPLIGIEAGKLTRVLG